MKSLYFLCMFSTLYACVAAPEKNNLHQPIYKTETIPIDTTRIQFPWLEHYEVKNNLQNSIPLPKGYYRETATTNSFGYWLRHLPLKQDDMIVNLYNGEEKWIQSAQFAIVDIDVGTTNLQQCADAVMRLRAEYLYAQKQFHLIHFNYTSGDRVSWDNWRKGLRPSLMGNSIHWNQTAKASDGYDNFKKYLLNIFSYAGSLSLSKELKMVSDIHEIQVGDVVIRGGTPGHAVIVMDVAVNNKTGKKIFLLAQSYMPAQEVHLLKNPMNEDLSPWYEEDFGNDLITPQFTFSRNELMRFQ